SPSSSSKESRPLRRLDSLALVLHPEQSLQELGRLWQQAIAASVSAERSELPQGGLHPALDSMELRQVVTAIWDDTPKRRDFFRLIGLPEPVKSSSAASSAASTEANQSQLEL